MNSIKEKMRPVFAKLDGGLFSTSGKADVGDVAERMRQQNVALMSWADPFFPDPSIPEDVLQAALEALNGGFPSHYTMPIGSPELKKLIAARIYRNYGLTINPERNIIINPGSDNGLLFAMFPWICPGDEVMVHDPSYPNSFLDPELLGGVTVRVPTYREDSFHLRIEEYEKRVTDRTKMVLLTNPNNPTGVCFTRQELEELAAFCVRHDLICICDQAFEDTTMPDHEMICMASLPGMWERTVTVCSVSKGMGLSGFRVGWTYANDVIMDVYYGAAVNIQGATSTLAQLAVVPAFQNDAFIAEYKAKYLERHQYAYNRLNSIPGISVELPEAGFYLWIDVSGLGDSSQIVNYLIHEAKVSTNDGKFYGAQGDGYIRLIDGCFWENKDCFAALDRVAEALQKLADKQDFKTINR